MIKTKKDNQRIMSKNTVLKHAKLKVIFLHTRDMDVFVNITGFPSS